MKNFRHEHGALNFETIKAKPIFDGDELRDIQEERSNRATQIIEDFMIAANGVTARYLAAKQFPSIRRVVRTPKDGSGLSRLPMSTGLSFHLTRIPKH